MEEISKRFDKVDERLIAIQTLQAVHGEQLKEHMRRSDLLEKRIEQVDKELKPVEKHVAMMQGALKFIGLLGTIAALLLAIKRII